MKVSKKITEATVKELEVNSKTNCNQLDGYESVHFKSEDGEPLELKMSPDGLLMIKSVKINKNTTLESIIVSGFTPEEVKSKSKGFFGKLWKKIKKAVNDVIDAVTFPIGFFKCRPTASIGTHGGRVTSVYIGINCFD